MKRMVCFVMAVMLAALSLTACGTTGGGKVDSKPGASTAAQPEGKTVHGVINRKGDFLVLLTDDGDYQIMDYGKGVNVDDFAEGDKVNITYTGELGVEGSTPVIVAISKAE